MAQISLAELEEILKTLQKAMAVITLAVVLICMTASIKAKADTIEASEVLAANVPGADLTSIAYAYTNLNDEQRLIADYLMGAYNYVYLCARGFSFNIDQTETNMKATLGAVGERIFQYLTTEYAWRSRFNEVFRQYASSIIVYASKQNVIFDTWINDVLSGTRNIYIEYTEDAFDAWTEFYNDPSGDGIESFGAVVGPWDSGITYDFAFVGMPWNSNSDQNVYNNFILNYSPVIYTSVYTYADTGLEIYQRQAALSMQNEKTIDAVFIQRGSAQYARYGYSDFDLTFPNNKVYFYALNYTTDRYGNVYIVSQAPYSVSGRGVIDHASADYKALLEYVFDITPFNIDRYGAGAFAKYWYPYIEHVYLVDDINTLSNPEEIYNIDDFNIVQGGMSDYIITPNGKMLIPGYAPITDPFAELWDVSVDVNGDTVTEDDFNTQIVNNTVINNYTIDASDKINVPVDWFDNELSDQLANDSIPFLSFARDCIDCLGDLQIYFYGAIVFGLGGGVLKKLLL